MSEVETHPVQTQRAFSEVQEHPVGARLPAAVTRRAYEVYCDVWGPQDALVTGDCRGGFQMSEIVAFLYARSFPKEEWPERISEAVEGEKL